MENLSISSGLAFVFGVFHVLEPGHGKTALLTYVASGQKTWKEGVVISVTSAVTHSLAVFVLAFASHSFFYFSESSSEEHIHHIGGFLSYFSGGVIACIGVFFIYRYIKGAETKECTSCSHHKSETKKSARGKYLTSGLLGIATGMIPCPTIVVAYLSGISRGDSLGGIYSVVLFAIGMCLSLLAVVTFVSFGGEKFFKRISGNNLASKWELVQGCAFIVIGIITTLYH